MERVHRQRHVLPWSGSVCELRSLNAQQVLAVPGDAR